MARKTSYTLELTGELVAVTPLHIGGADTGDTVDMPFARDGAGNLYIPGTSLAGAIRAWEGMADVSDDLWGYAGKSDLEDHASHLIFDDAPLRIDAGDGGAATELWHGIGIDRHSGATATGIKFDREVLPRGSRFGFRLQLEVPPDSNIEGVLTRIARIQVGLEEGYIEIGGSVTRGFGGVRLQKAEHRVVNWGSREGVLAWLQNDSLATSPLREQWQEAYRVASSQAASLRRHIEIAIHWRPKGPVMVKSAHEGVAVDGMPFVSRGEDDHYLLTLPGSSLKGALRQHAERIMRTVLDDPADISKVHPRDQVKVDLVAAIFGAARAVDAPPRAATDAGQPAVPPDGTGGRGLLSVYTCYADLGYTLSQWRDMEELTSAWHRGRLTVAGNDQPLYRADRIAIDRWLGRPVDGALYSVVEPDSNTVWEPMRLRLRPLPESGAGGALLWLLLRDLCAGRIPLGFGVNRGFGDIEVARVDIAGYGAADFSCLGDRAIELDVTAGALNETAAAEVVKTFAGAWTRYLAGKGIDVGSGRGE